MNDQTATTVAVLVALVVTAAIVAAALLPTIQRAFTLTPA